MAPRVGFEPTTLRLTAGCSAVELPRNIRAFMKCLTARLPIIHKQMNVRVIFVNNCEALHNEMDGEV